MSLPVSNTTKDIAVVKPQTEDSPIAMDPKARQAAKKVQRSFEQTAGSIGLLVTAELETAIAQCKAQVETIAANCRARNQKFRDEDFDLENHRNECLWGLEKPVTAETGYNPAGIMRVGDIFEKPVFFEDGASSSDIKQGNLGDCWFLSGLAVVATVPDLIEKICVARDEPSGVYGFIFFRDSSWFEVIIDDQLFVSAYSYDWLTPEQKALYKNNPDLYDSIGRKGSDILYYARCSTENETWVPLIEKAYAKFYGNYSYISGGFTCHAMEDLTGGLCRRVLLNDILDKDLLWEQIRGNMDHSKLYGCGSISALETFTSRGLITRHAYAILRAGEYNGKRFLVIRNPWGDETEWNGRWSDGSKDWTPEWRPALDVLKHTFGKDGAFIMEYSEFLRQWPMLDITRIFDISWVSSSIWIDLPGMVVGQVPTWGNVSFTINVPEKTEALISLQQVDSRAFQEISGYVQYDLSFVVFKKGSTKEVASSQSCLRWEARGQIAEVELEAGQYVVHVRINPGYLRESNYIETGQVTWSKDVFRKLVARRTAAYAKAINCPVETSEELLPTTIESIAGYDLTELEMKTVEKKRADVKKKATLREARISKVPKAEPAAVTTEESKVEASTVTTSNSSEAPKETPVDGSGATPSAGTTSTTTEEPKYDTSKSAEEVTIPATVLAPEKTPKEMSIAGSTTAVEAAALGGNSVVTEEPKYDSETASDKSLVGATTTTPEEAPKEAPAEGLTGSTEQPNASAVKPAEVPTATTPPTSEGTLKETPIEDSTAIAKAPLTNGTGGAGKPSGEALVGIATTTPEEGPKEIPLSCSKTGAEPAITSPTLPESKPTEAEVVKPKQWEHVHVSCNLCLISPIAGPRFHCTDASCPDFDLCIACFSKQVHDQTHRMEVFCTPKEIVHHQACSTCNAKPIVGTIYKCSEVGCTLPFSCGTCFAKVPHNLKHPIVMQREVDDGQPTGDRPVHVGIHCDHCEMSPIIGTRYKCMDAKCSDYDLCEGCVIKGIHDATHQMLPIKTPEEAEYLHPGVSNGSPLVLGLRVYTKSTAKVILGAQLKHLR